MLFTPTDSWNRSLDQGIEARAEIARVITKSWMLGIPVSHEIEGNSLTGEDDDISDIFDTLTAVTAPGCMHSHRARLDIMAQEVKSQRLDRICSKSFGLQGVSTDGGRLSLRSAGAMVPARPS